MLLQYIFVFRLKQRKYLVQLENEIMFINLCKFICICCRAIFNVTFTFTSVSGMSDQLKMDSMKPGGPRMPPVVANIAEYRRALLGAPMTSEVVQESDK